MHLDLYQRATSRNAEYELLEMWMIKTTMIVVIVLTMPIMCWCDDNNDSNNVGQSEACVCIALINLSAPPSGKYDPVTFKMNEVFKI